MSVHWNQQKRCSEPNKWALSISRPQPKPLVAISQCLLGEPVRYDGQSKYNPRLVRSFEKHFKLTPICPEVEIGLGIPRPALQLSGDPQAPEMTGRDNPELNTSHLMKAYCVNKPLSLSLICGYIFKSKSPSCGLLDTPVFLHGEIIHRGPGLFTRAIMRHLPNLPLADEVQLNTDFSQQQFMEQMKRYYQQYLL